MKVEEKLYSETQGQRVPLTNDSEAEKVKPLSDGFRPGGNTTLWMTSCWFSNSHQASLFKAHVHDDGDFLERRGCVICSMHELKMGETMSVHGKYTLRQNETCLWCASITASLVPLSNTNNNTSYDSISNETSRVKICSHNLRCQVLFCVSPSLFVSPLQTWWLSWVTLLIQIQIRILIHFLVHVWFDFEAMVKVMWFRWKGSHCRDWNSGQGREGVWNRTLVVTPTSTILSGWLCHSERPKENMFHLSALVP